MKADLGITLNEGRYLKLIYRKRREESTIVGTTTIAECFGIKPATVTEMLQKLSKKGLLKYKRYRQTELTEKGIIEAKKLLRRHRLLEILFVRFLNYNSQNACDEANELDHHVSDELTNAICQVYDHPKRCPCDNPIFRNEECCGIK